MTRYRPFVRLLFRACRILSLCILIFGAVTGYRIVQRLAQQNELSRIEERLARPIAVYRDKEPTGSWWQSTPGKWLLANTNLFGSTIQRLSIYATDDKVVARVLSLTAALSECRELHWSTPSEASVRKIEHLASLELLYVSKIEFVDELLDVVLTKPRIQRLGLFETELTAAQLERLKSATWLKWLLLPGVDPNDAGCRDLRDALPNTYVVFNCSPPVVGRPEFVYRTKEAQ